MPLFLAQREEKVNISPLEAPNGSLAVFTTPDIFDPDSLRLYRNGQRQTLSQDYLLSESAGTDTGFDTFTFIEKSPKTWEVLRLDYNIGC